MTALRASGALAGAERDPVEREPPDRVVGDAGRHAPSGRMSILATWFGSPASVMAIVLATGR